MNLHAYKNLESHLAAGARKDLTLAPHIHPQFLPGEGCPFQIIVSKDSVLKQPTTFYVRRTKPVPCDTKCVTQTV